MTKQQIRESRKQMLKEFFPLLLAIGLMSILSLTVNLVDNFMLGRYSEEAMSAASIVNQIQAILGMLCGGIGAGVSVLGSQYWGKKETTPIKRVLSVGFKFAVVAGLIFTLLTALLPAQILSIFTNDPNLISAGVDYLSIMCWTYIIYASSSVLMFSMQAVGSAFIGTVMSAMTICINACLNYVFIFGHFGAPQMGIKGAAVATCTSRIVELITITVYIRFIDKKLNCKIHNILAFDFAYLSDFVKVALPIMVSGLLWGIAQSAQTAILGHISEAAIAANAIAALFMQLFGSFGMSCANAGSVTMGKTIGEGNMELVKPFARTLQLVFLGLGVVSGAVLFLLRNVIVSFYKISPETKELTIAFIIIFAITMVGSIYEFPVEGGIIAGGGDPKYQAIVDNLFMWVYTIPFAFLSAFVFNWSPIVTFIILKSDQILKCIPNGIYCNSFKWVRNLTRELE